MLDPVSAKSPFQSTPPVKAATVVGLINGRLSSISIHAAREGGDNIAVLVNSCGSISIHAAREGGDQPCSAPARQSRISIHAAREGGDRRVYANNTHKRYFNPRRP